MYESIDDLKTLLQSLLTRFDESKLTSDKELESQLVFNAHVSTNLANLHKKMDLTLADIDEVPDHHDPPLSRCAAVL